MLHFTTLITTLCLMSAVNAGLVTTHHVIHEPTLANVGHVVHSAPSSVSHQSITQVHGKTHVVEPIFTPVVKTTVHAPSPLVVKSVEPVISVAKTIHSPPIQTYYHAAPVVHSVPLLHSSPLLSIHEHHH